MTYFTLKILDYKCKHVLNKMFKLFKIIKVILLAFDGFFIAKFGIFS